MDSASGDAISLASARDPQIPLSNLSELSRKMDSLQQFLAQSVDRHTLLGQDQMDMVSSEITSAIHQIFVNGAALLSSSSCQKPSDLMSLRSQVGGALNRADRTAGWSSQTDVQLKESSDAKNRGGSKPNVVDFTRDVVTIVSVADQFVDLSNRCNSTDSMNPKLNVLDFESSFGGDLAVEEETEKGIDDGECEIVEIGAVDLLAEHIHVCDVCGKGFKRDANLRMHMRAHGNEYKTVEALAKPAHDRSTSSSLESYNTLRRIRFSCPFQGCNRNKLHKKFRPLKSALCVKNHFKRSHCPKMYSCHVCNKKSFSVVADLKSHVRHCGESKWRCSCGTTFSRKDKLFGHMALFEGHMPAVEDDEKLKGAGASIGLEEESVVDAQLNLEIGGSNGYDNAQLRPELVRNGSDVGFFDRVLEGFNSIDDLYFDDVFGSPRLNKGLQELYEML
ncbi:hypothetical protein Sjap_018767 [Stephania japonica]|uniref:C2H2-type domain-containing protein n=1 Tax=Stephania japonica TaxID=461633 RepID=A0AAP0NJT2_9MAGN